jgi:hypothetical protein
MSFERSSPLHSSVMPRPKAKRRIDGFGSRRKDYVGHLCLVLSLKLHVVVRPAAYAKWLKALFALVSY